MREQLVKFGWLVAAAAAIALYVWRPVWPHGVARIPMWPCLALFGVWAFLCARHCNKNPTARAAMVSSGMIALYLYLEHSFVWAVRRAMLFTTDLDLLVAYMVIPLMNVLLNLPVVIAFATTAAVVLFMGRDNARTALERA